MGQYISALTDIGYDIEVEDDATIFTGYENGATGVFITSTGEYPGTNRLEISGTKGKIVIENRVLKWWKLKKDEREVSKNSAEGFVNIETEHIEIKQDAQETVPNIFGEIFADFQFNEKVVKVHLKEKNGVMVEA